MRISGAAAYRELRRREAVRAAQAGGALSFRAFAESADFCRLTLSPLMAAIADAADGRPVSLDDAACVRHFGCPAAGLPKERRRTVAVRAGGRGGKTSRLVAPKALHAAWTVPLPTLAHGEVASALLVAPDLKLARQALSFVAGYVDASPVLRAALVREPTQEAVTLRRPDGKLVRVEVLAATRGGRAVRARTLVFAALDEAAFFYAEGSGVVNDAEIRNAVEQRVVPGGQVWITSTPWLADLGELETTIGANWGTHGTALVATSGTRALNPSWDPDGEIERGMRARDPDAARREIDGLPLAGGASSFFEAATIDAAVEPTLAIPRKPLPGEEVTAGGDLGFRSDASALAIVHRGWLSPKKGEVARLPIRPPGLVLRVGDLLEQRPEAGQPLVPSATIRAMGARMKAHAGLSYLVADGHYRETLSEHLADMDLSYKAAPTDVSAPYVRTRALMREGRVQIPNHPRLIAQLKAVQWRANSGGSISILLPRERAGGHCDLVSAFVLAVWEAAGSGLEVMAPAPEPGTAEYEAEVERRDLEAIEARDRPWWEQ